MIIKYKKRKDGKYMITEVFNGRVIRSIVTQEVAEKMFHHEKTA